jgi:hypothetical protein
MNPRGSPHILSNSSSFTSHPAVLLHSLEYWQHHRTSHTQNNMAIRLEMHITEVPCFRIFCSHYLTSRKVTGSIPDEIIWVSNPSSRTMALGVDFASNGNEYQESYWRVQGGRRVRLTTSLPFVRRMYRKCASLDVKLPYGAPRPVIGIVVLFCFVLGPKILRSVRSQAFSSTFFFQSERPLFFHKLTKLQEKECTRQKYHNTWIP